MLPDIHLDEVLLHRRQIGIAAAGTVTAIGLIWWIVRLRRPSAEEIERRRRQRVALVGRIIDGIITDFTLAESAPADSTIPHVIFYQYLIAGVSYECAQDVSTLTGYIQHFSIAAPVQFKYDPRNPADSIILSESWTGLYLTPATAIARKTQTA